MPLTELDFTLAINFQARARTPAGTTWLKKPIYGLGASPAFRLAKAIANATAGGADNLLADVFEAAVGTPIDVNLQSFTDIAEQAGQSMVRVKVFACMLLRAADDPTNGNACTGCEVAVSAANGWLGILKAVGDAVKLQPGMLALFATPSAGGWTTDATHKLLTLTNTDGTLPARVLVVAAGGST